MTGARWPRRWVLGLAIGLCSMATWAVAQQPQTKEAPAKQKSAACIPAPRNDPWWTQRQEQLNARVKQARATWT